MSDGCWLWTGPLTSKGYGACSDGRRAHRVAFENAGGSIPDGFDVHHECGVRSCVNPNHLRAIDHAEHASLHRARPTHCPQGHLYDEANTYFPPSGGMQCRACTRDRHRVAYRARSLSATKEKDQSACSL